ncbi:MAG: endonuclease [Candidatus Izemoplasmatales bacterium]
MQDPVDDFELNRNNVIYDYQGNRNPFIDNPEYVDLIWGEDDTN